MRPKAIVTVNGRPVAGVFWERLISLTVVDHEGAQSDTVDITLEDGAPFAQIPAADDVIEVSLGYEDGPMENMGRFTVNDVELDMFPWQIQIKGKAADQKEKLKQPRRRHFDKKTFGDVVKTIAGEHGLSAQVDPSIASFKPDSEWFGQDGESDIHFLERWSRRLDGLFAVKGGKMIVGARGSGKTPGGASLPTLVVTPEMHIKKSCKVHFGQKERHGKARAEHHDWDTGRREHEDAATGDRGSSAVYSQRHATGGKSESKRAARSASKYLKRGGTRTSVGLVGNPFVKAGQIMTYSGFRPRVDGLQFVIETAEHKYTKSGYRTDVKAKIKDDSKPSSGGASAGSGGTAGKSTAADGATAPASSNYTYAPGDGGEGF
jgi:hypothetical protein